MLKRNEIKLPILPSAHFSASGPVFGVKLEKDLG